MEKKSSGNQEKPRAGVEEGQHLPMPETVANEKPTKNPLSSYMVKPKLEFETQDREEKIVLLLRRHPLSNLRWVMLSCFLALVPVFWSLVPVFDFFPVRFQIIFYVLWYLLVTAYVLEHLLSWYYNVHIITDERIVDVDFYSLLYKEVSDSKIENIQDVTFVMGGALRAMFNYGTVYIQTAGEKREFDFDDVPRPDRVAKVINELLLEEEQEKIEGRVR